MESVAKSTCGEEVNYLKNIVVKKRKNSMYIRLPKTVIAVGENVQWNSSSDAIVRIIEMSQEFLDKLSIDHPRAALRIIRSIIYEIASLTNLVSPDSIIIDGEGLSV